MEKSGPLDQFTSRFDSRADEHGTEIFVGNLGIFCGEAELRSLVLTNVFQISECDQEGAYIKEVKIIKARGSANALGYGFVSLSSHEMAMRCILALRDFFYEGRFLKVGWAKKNTKLLIDNIGESSSINDVLDVFKRYGPIIESGCCVRTDSLKSRFAVIEFVSRMDAELAKLDVERAVKESEIKVGKEFTSTARAASADLLRGESSTAMDMRTERIAALLPHDTQPATSVGSQVTKSLLTRKLVIYWYGSSAARRKMRPKDLEDSDDIPPSASVFYKFRTKVADMSVSENLLRKIFGNYSSLQDVQIKISRETDGMQGGYGFLDFSNDEEGLQSALSLLLASPPYTDDTELASRITFGIEPSKNLKKLLRNLNMEIPPGHKIEGEEGEDMGALSPDSGSYYIDSPPSHTPRARAEESSPPKESPSRKGHRDGTEASKAMGHTKKSHGTPSSESRRSASKKSHGNSESVFFSGSSPPGTSAAPSSASLSPPRPSQDTSSILSIDASSSLPVSASAASNLPKTDLITNTVRETIPVSQGTLATTGEEVPAAPPINSSLSQERAAGLSASSSSSLPKHNSEVGSYQQSGLWVPLGNRDGTLASEQASISYSGNALSSTVNRVSSDRSGASFPVSQEYDPSSITRGTEFVQMAPGAPMTLPPMGPAATSAYSYVAHPSSFLSPYYMNVMRPTYIVQNPSPPLYRGSYYAPPHGMVYQHYYSPQPQQHQHQSYQQQQQHQSYQQQTMTPPLIHGTYHSPGYTFSGGSEYYSPATEFSSPSSTMFYYPGASPSPRTHETALSPGLGMMGLIYPSGSSTAPSSLHRMQSFPTGRDAQRGRSWLENQARGCGRGQDDVRYQGHGHVVDRTQRMSLSRFPRETVPEQVDREGEAGSNPFPVMPRHLSNEPGRRGVAWARGRWPRSRTASIADRSGMGRNSGNSSFRSSNSGRTTVSADASRDVSPAIDSRSLTPKDMKGPERS